MITEQDKTTIIENLGKKYSKKILPEINKKGLVNRYNKPFSNRSINDIVNGDTENLLIEKLIFQLIKKNKQEIQKLQEFKNSI